MKEKLRELLQKAQKFYEDLQDREELFFLLLLAVVFVIGFYSLAEKAYAKYQKAQSELLKAEREYRLIAPLLTRYHSLQLKKEEVEKRLRKYQAPKEGLRSYLEDIANKEGLLRLSVTVGKETAFGTEFKQKSLNVSFRADDFSKIVDFLKTLQTSKYMLIVSSLKIDRSYSYFKVEARLVNIYPANSASI